MEVTVDGCGGGRRIEEKGRKAVEGRGGHHCVEGGHEREQEGEAVRA